MPLPLTQYRWATNDVQETVTIGGNAIVVDNKVEPTTAVLNSGTLARQPLIRPYLNYMLQSHGAWIEWLRIGEVGDFKIMPTSATSSSMATRFGGTWTDLGTTTFTLSPSGAQTVRLSVRAT